MSVINTIRPLAAIALFLSSPLSAKDAQPMQHATGTFIVKITPEASADAPDGGVPTARMGIAKTFSGDLVGNAVGTMLSGGAPKPGSAAAYVAIDQFHGAVDGKTGGFMLIHKGIMTKAGGGDLSVEIAPDSGTGALTGITGSLSIEVKDGVHHYDLTYHLPG